MNVHTTLLLVVLSSILYVTSSAQIILPYKGPSDYPKSMVSYTDFENLMVEVKGIRAKRLISFEQIKAFQADSNTVLLDARSRDRFESRHLKGAINLPYTDFTQENLRKIIPDPNTRVLIYCNNNFIGDNVDFASKGITGGIMITGIYLPNKEKSKWWNNRNRRKFKKRINNIPAPQKQVMLALNVPTYITLYGYGYRNIYELNELVDVSKARADFEGTKNGRQSMSVMVYPGKE